MTDREALAAALDPAVRDYGWLKVLEAAAQERLAQMGEKCGRCDGRGDLDTDEEYRVTPCPDCRTKGFLYPSALVERIASAVFDFDRVEPPETRGRYQRLASAVLDALNTESL